MPPCNRPQCAVGPFRVLMQYGEKLWSSWCNLIEVALASGTRTSAGPTVNGLYVEQSAVLLCKAAPPRGRLIGTRSGRGKIKKLARLMKREGLDALYLNRIENVRYTTDLRPVVSMWFQNSYSSVVTSSGDWSSLTVAGDYMHSKHYMPWIKDMRIMHGLGRAEEVAAVFRDYRVRRIGYDQLSYEDRLSLETASKGVELVSVGAEGRRCEGGEVRRRGSPHPRGLEGQPRLQSGRRSPRKARREGVRDTPPRASTPPGRWGRRACPGGSRRSRGSTPA